MIGYGPTENTTFTCCYAMSDERQVGDSVPIGHPIANTQVYVLDERLQPTPIGVPGELCAGGDGLARGYLNRPDLTAERFIPDPFSAEPGARLYRTGDLVRWQADGNLEFLGRMDFQVKIRGFRIELGEIEAVLGQHPGVRESVVNVYTDEHASGDKRLVAYVVANAAQVPNAGDLRQYLQARLPEYMLPASFVFLDAWPLNPNGKVDRRALPVPEGERPEHLGTFVAPRNPVEELVAGSVAEILSLERVGVYDNFFELGGHSLLATQVISRVRQTFDVELPLRSLFEEPTVAGLAKQVEMARLAQRHLSMLPLQPVAREGELALSFAQQRLWFLDQLEPASPLYKLPAAVRMECCT